MSKTFEQETGVSPPMLASTLPRVLNTVQKVAFATSVQDKKYAQKLNERTSKDGLSSQGLCPEVKPKNDSVSKDATSSRVKALAARMTNTARKTVRGSPVEVSEKWDNEWTSTKSGKGLMTKPKLKRYAKVISAPSSGTTIPFETTGKSSKKRRAGGLERSQSCYSQVQLDATKADGQPLKPVSPLKGTPCNGGMAMTQKNAYASTNTPMMSKSHNFSPYWMDTNYDSQSKEDLSTLDGPESSSLQISNRFMTKPTLPTEQPWIDGLDLYEAAGMANTSISDPDFQLSEEDLEENEDWENIFSQYPEF